MTWRLPLGGAVVSGGGWWRGEVGYGGLRGFQDFGELRLVTSVSPVDHVRWVCRWRGAGCGKLGRTDA